MGQSGREEIAYLQISIQELVPLIEETNETREANRGIRESCSGVDPK